MFPATETWGKMEYEPSTFSCTLKSYYENESRWNNPLIIFAIIVFAFPLVIMATSFILVRIKVRLSRNELSRIDGNCQMFGPSENLEKAISKTACYVVGAYIFFTFPMALVVAFHPMPPNKGKQIKCRNDFWALSLNLLFILPDLPGLHVGFFILGWIGVSVNPFIYVFSNGFYKRAFEKTCFPDRSNFTASDIANHNNYQYYTTPRPKRRYNSSFYAPRPGRNNPTLGYRNDPMRNNQTLDHRNNPMTYAEIPVREHSSELTIIVTPRSSNTSNVS